MNARKSELRDIVLAVIFGKEEVNYPPNQFNHLAMGVALILSRRSGGVSFSSPEPRLSNSDTMLVQEVFWDLVVERVITIGLDAENSLFPWFRLHSDAETNLKRVNF